MTGTRVLYVDADRGRAEEVTASFEATDLEVLRAESGVDALKRLEATTVDCVLSYGTLPDLPVDRFVERVADADGSPPIVVVGEGSPGFAAAALSAGATEYLDPGLDAEREILDRVRSAVADRRIQRGIDRQGRLDAATADLARALLDASDRGEVERATRDALVESGLYRVAWIGVPTPAGEIEVNRPFVGRIEFDTGSDPDAETPIESAIEDGSVVVREGFGSLVRGDPPSASDRDDAPVERVAVVPITGTGEVHGVVLLASRDPDALDRAERARLRDLGRIVGGALDDRGDGATPETSSRRVVEAIAHELRGTVGIASTQLEVARESDDEAALDRAAEAIDRLERTIGNVLAVAGEDAIEDATSLDLHEIATDVWARIETGGAELETGPSRQVHADEEALRRLFENLFQNAVEHAGPDVTVEVGATEDGFYVADDGPGFPEDARDRVFEWGYTTREDGSGIGLGVVRGIVEAHGWSIAAERAEGARFEVAGVDPAPDSS